MDSDFGADIFDHDDQDRPPKGRDTDAPSAGSDTPPPSGSDETPVDADDGEAKPAPPAKKKKATRRKKATKKAAAAGDEPAGDAPDAPAATADVVAEADAEAKPTRRKKAKATKKKASRRKAAAAEPAEPPAEAEAPPAEAVSADAPADETSAGSPLPRVDVTWDDDGVPATPEPEAAAEAPTPPEGGDDGTDDGEAIVERRPRRRRRRDADGLHSRPEASDDEAAEPTAPADAPTAATAGSPADEDDESGDGRRRRRRRRRRGGGGGNNGEEPSTASGRGGTDAPSAPPPRPVFDANASADALPSSSTRTKQERVGVFIDVDAALSGLRRDGREPSWRKLVDSVAGRRTPTRVVAYGADTALDGERLALQQADIEIRETTDDRTAAVSLTVDVLAIRDRLEAVVLVPANGALAPLAEALRAHGVTVEGARFDEASDVLAPLPCQRVHALGESCTFRP